MKLEKRTNFYFKNTKKDIIITEEDGEDLKNNNPFCGEKIESDRIRDPCHPAVKFRKSAHNTCNMNVTQKQCNYFVPFLFHNFNNYDCHLSKELVDKKNDRVTFDITTKTNEEDISLTCVLLDLLIVIDSYHIV